jgi:hypothetical protein
MHHLQGWQECGVGAAAQKFHYFLECFKTDPLSITIVLKNSKQSIYFVSFPQQKSIGYIMSIQISSAD